jgi:hypothetical protein
MGVISLLNIHTPSLQEKILDKFKITIELHFYFTENK